MVYLVVGQNQILRSFLKDFQSVWLQCLSVTTFTLTFFVNQAYGLFKTCLGISRTVQGRLNDLMMTLSVAAVRDHSNSSSSHFTPRSRQMLLILARYVRLFNIFSYGSFTRSHRPLLTPRGMRRLVERGLMTAKERRILVEADIAATQRHNAVLLWIFRTIVEAQKAKLIETGPGFEQQIVLRIQEIRGQANTMEGELRGRMPFAYAHIVQVLVDSMLWLYPLGSVSSGFSFQIGVIGTIVLTMSYQGLFNLAKRLLDPFYNENFWNGDDALVVDTLIAETNAGSVRWINGLEELPLTADDLASGDLDEFVLPNEGYTVKEAKEMQEKAIKEAAAEQPVPKERLSPAEIVQKATEVLEAAVEEYEETRLILNAPPASDFVPGLDDGDNTFDEMTSTALSPSNSTLPSDDHIETAAERFEEFLGATENEFLDISH